jgi:hypothetical protein
MGHPVRVSAPSARAYDQMAPLRRPKRIGAPKKIGPLEGDSAW